MTPPTTIKTVTVTVTYVPPTTTVPIPTSRVTSVGDGITRTVTTTLVAPVDKRQVLGSPTRSVLVWPTWPWSFPTHPTTIKTVTVTETVLPPTLGGDSSGPPTPTLTVPLDKRQTLGEPTRTVLLPTTLTSEVYVTTTVTYTEIVPTTVRTTVVSESDKYLTTTKVTTATVRYPVTKTITDSETEIDTVTATSTTTYTEIWDVPTTSPVASRSTTTDDGTSRTVPTTLTVPIKERQELGGGAPSFSVSWYGGGTGIPWQTLGIGKRQELGQPTRSFTFDGAVPVATETRSATYFREM